MNVTETMVVKTWAQEFTAAEKMLAIEALEAGKIILLPNLVFDLDEQERAFLTPAIADSRSKNISYDAKHNSIRGVVGGESEQQAVKAMMQRFSKRAKQLVLNLFEHYQPALITARTSFRPVEILGRTISYKKDDTRLHVDAFPANPNQGKRILRVFSNINPSGDRIWRVGEPFENVAERFLPKIRKPIPGSAALLARLKITKSLRTLYDHIMLQIHDRMKADLKYQATAQQIGIQFPPNCTWIVQTDQVSHAAMRGQHVLEQTFYLPVQAMLDESRSPLRILEKMTDMALV